MNPNTFAVVSTMKNEAPYIIDWVAHYKTLGFDFIAVASNDCTDQTDPILDRLQEMGEIIHHNTIVRRGGIQRSAIRQLTRRYKDILESEWVFICDSDEYLNIHVGDGSVQELVKVSGENMDAIVVPWRNFGPNGIEEIDDIPVTEQFLIGELPYDSKLRPSVGKFTKSLVRNRSKFKRMGLHIPVQNSKRDNTDVNTVLPGGAGYHVEGTFIAPEISFEIAQVNHYALKSLKSYLVKRQRGRANHSSHVLGTDYWIRFNLKGEMDTTISRYKSKKSKYVDKLMKDDELSRLHKESVKWHQDKAASIAIDPENSELVQALRELNTGNLA